jgi:hypothetical protein
MTEISLETALRPLWEDQDLPAIVSLFEEREARISALNTDDVAVMEFYYFLPFKWYALRETNAALLQDDVERLVKATADNSLLWVIVLSRLPQALDFCLDLLQQAFGSPRRFIEATRVRLAGESGDLMTRLTALADFDAIADIPEYEWRIVIATAEDNRFLSRDTVETAVLQSLPNNNRYFSATFEGGELLLPLPENDAICESGHIHLPALGIEQQEINRYQVAENPRYSPYGLICELEGLTIEVANVTIWGKES